MPHLLLVDDDDFRESLGLNLIDEGFDVTSFASGATRSTISRTAAAPTPSCSTGACRS